MKNDIEIFKYFENPSFLNIYIKNRKVLVKISYKNSDSLQFIIEFNFNDKFHKQVLEKITTKEKYYNSDEIEIDGIELDQKERERIATSLNEILHFIFS